jgi:hypothetical protein
LALHFRLKVFEKRVLRRTFKPKREVTAAGRKEYAEMLHDLNFLPNIIRGIKERKMN